MTAKLLSNTPKGMVGVLCVCVCVMSVWESEKRERGGGGGLMGEKAKMCLLACWLAGSREQGKRED